MGQAMNRFVHQAKITEKINTERDGCQQSDGATSLKSEINRAKQNGVDPEVQGESVGSKREIQFFSN